MFTWWLLLIPGIIAFNVPFMNTAQVTHSGKLSSTSKCFQLSILLSFFFPILGPSTSSKLAENSDEVHRSKRGYYFSQFDQYSNNLLVQPQEPDDLMKKWITYEHNRYRRMVPATDMNMLYWSDELAASAQRHANTCDFRHSKGRVNVGENIWAAPYSNYSDAITLWFDEVNNPRCGCNHAYKHCCGHYVQVSKTQFCAWARASAGLWGRGHRNVFVCHYNPQGNTVFVTGSGQLYAVPAFTWATGDKGRCSDCPSSAPACFQGLCYMPSEVRETEQSTTPSENSDYNETNATETNY
ncbi:unnamed protein product [Cylicostephanus goldi]|uniref:SCP domain-containing protein n=1 Tax=Cylicostephanus goldi TaxID=71465 RepID=A0A3P7MEC9_CYLGO|nr:unnamed protein product [Cylicostephanus goldi]